MEKKQVEFKSLKGLIFNKIKKGEDSDGFDYIHFYVNDNTYFEMKHSQSCCEEVWIEDICGNLNDLVNLPILYAEEITYHGENHEEIKRVPEGCVVPDSFDPSTETSFTWTFYKIGTMKGGVTLRWFGTSNGCYSEYADLHRVVQDYVN